MIDARKLRAIIESEDEDLRSLAKIAGGDPATFYRGANFDDTDLRGEDLRGFNLRAATFERARVDRNTKVDIAFSGKLGLQRKMIIDIPMRDIIIVALSASHVTLESPANEHLGDILEDAIFGAEARMYLREARGLRLLFGDISGWGSAGIIDKPLSKNIISKLKPVLKASDVANRMHDKVARVNERKPFRYLPLLHSLSLTSLHNTSRIRASLSGRTTSAVSKLAKREKIEVPELCAALLLAYASLQDVNFGERLVGVLRRAERKTSTAL